MTDNSSNPTEGTGSNADPESVLASLVTDIIDNHQDERDDEDASEDVSQETQSADDESLEPSDEQSDEGEEASEDGEDSAEKTEAAEPTYPVQLGDKVVQVPLSELTADYQRRANYTQKTQALAEERKQFEETRNSFQTEAQAVVQERGQYKALLGQLHQAIAQLSPQEPTPEQWARLREENPAEFAAARETWRMLADKKQAAAAELQRLQAQETAKQQQQWQAHVQQAAQTFRDSIPAWKDEAVGRKELGELVQYARTLGYTDPEIQMASDPRALKALYNSMKFEALQSNAKNLKPVKKGRTMAAGSPQRNVESRRSDASKRLARSGSTDDFAAFLSTIPDL